MKYRIVEENFDYLCSDYLKLEDWKKGACFWVRPIVSCCLVGKDAAGTHKLLSSKVYKQHTSIVLSISCGHTVQKQSWQGICV